MSLVSVSSYWFWKLSISCLHSVTFHRTNPLSLLLAWVSPKRVVERQEKDWFCLVPMEPDFNFLVRTHRSESNITTTVYCACSCILLFALFLIFSHSPYFSISWLRLSILYFQHRYAFSLCTNDSLEMPRMCKQYTNYFFYSFNSLHDRLTVTNSCPMALQYFPLDRQLCSIEVESCE